MALPPNWYFGARNSLSDNPFGAFNLGGIQNPGSPLVQSSVATPNPASAGVAGTPAGQPPTTQPTGGMGVSLPEDRTGSPSAPASPSSNANVTGLNSGLISTGLTAATLGMASPFAALGPIGAPLAGMAARGLGHAALGTVPNGLVDNFGNPVTDTGNNMFGLPMGRLVYTASPDLSDPISVLSVSPNMGGFGASRVQKNPTLDAGSAREFG